MSKEGLLYLACLAAAILLYVFYLRLRVKDVAQVNEMKKTYPKHPRPKPATRQCLPKYCGNGLGIALAVYSVIWGLTSRPPGGGAEIVGSGFRCAGAYLLGYLVGASIGWFIGLFLPPATWACVKCASTKVAPSKQNIINGKRTPNRCLDCGYEWEWEDSPPNKTLQATAAAPTDLTHD